MIILLVHINIFISFQLHYIFHIVSYRTIRIVYYFIYDHNIPIKIYLYIYNITNFPNLSTYYSIPHSGPRFSRKERDLKKKFKNNSAAGGFAHLKYIEIN